MQKKVDYDCSISRAEKRVEEHGRSGRVHENGWCEEHEEEHVECAEKQEEARLALKAWEVPGL